MTDAISLPADLARLVPYFDKWFVCSTGGESPYSLPAAQEGEYRLVVLDGWVHAESDMYAALTAVKANLNRQGRVALTFYAPWMRLPLMLMKKLRPELRVIPGYADIDMLAKACGFEQVRRLRLGWFSAWRGVLLRPVAGEARVPSLSIVIPARNERGNIENALIRLSAWDRCPLEIIFVESHSTDGTWEEIQRVIALYAQHFTLKAMQVTARGKGPAATAGLIAASGDILTILDADLTMPPELLYQFYDAYVAGRADFINGNRFLYPMEGSAMQPLNYFGNRLYAMLLSKLLGVRLSDSLCGTKLFSRRDYARFLQWNNRFGKFDPFGDYELLFPAAVLGVGILDIPVRYRARTYGSTNISRFRHGLMLARMIAIGFLRLRRGK